ncbi:MAG TPA: putative quinol monooxygenase [Anaerohalosphaeraceae bacterium]|nr:antibiotic biosynthesis monooxygenase [Phycisphaerae bacterium]HOK95208.1 putative quinol monooxygenase [Anaerohalosphaeraceae bacterium]HOL31011.1 putative quinol monooxygenase [Anaerohalosphaeraceae bacterium]HOM75710.1 putative quinol monooxygenase [Anaerohalosphaeraceae bacterium]HPC64813.1 putative quinol monooxygenase [Anaerohalosphaeraceae bacterium]
MHIVHVFVDVKKDYIDKFKAATVENARHSRQEPGVIQFDVLQQQDEPSRFLLVEIYRSQQDATTHKGTAHYQKWRDTVADMMAQPRRSINYTMVSLPN